MQLRQGFLLSRTIPALLSRIHDERISLRDVHWRNLEEIIAELLRTFGLEIYVTKRTRDGGRDLIARGELIPGEPSVIAVEVKQKPNVGIADVQRALKANEDFPALLICTAGAFSAGVVAERGSERHAMRLFLKDGVAIHQWVDAYGRTKGWPAMHREGEIHLTE